MSGEKTILKLLEEPRHIAVLAGTGAGKTTLAKMLIRIAQQQGFRVVVIDWHGEYNLPRLTYPIGVEAKLLPEILAHIVEEESRTPGYSTFLAVQKALEEMNDFEDDIVNVLMKLAEVSYSLRLGAHAAASRIAAVRGLVNLRGKAEMEIRGSHRLDLGRLRYVQAKTLAALYTFQLYSHFKTHGAGEKTLIVLEESQNYSKPAKMLRELRHSNTKVVEILQYMPGDSYAKSLLANSTLAVGNTGMYAAELITRYHLPPTLTELRDGEFLVFLGSKVQRIRVF